ncbi:MAG: ABC transporter ATP-binding protein [Acidimicrobiales bacterium]
MGADFLTTTGRDEIIEPLGPQGAEPPAPHGATDGRLADVSVERVTKRFADVTAVDDLSLDVYSGEFFSLLGPSGCGKTTTLRMIGGFEEPTVGRIRLADQDVTTRPPYKRDVNTVFQSYALFPHLDVYENVAFGLQRKKVQRRDIARRVREVLELVDLLEQQRRKPSQLSGGQQQRVALARALVNHPKLLLLDEPMSALDAKLRKQMQIELKRIQKEVGITFLYVTHDQEEAMTMSDRIAVMRNGRIEDLGSPERVYDCPSTEFVAGFLGASNLLGGVVAEPRGTDATVLLDAGAPVAVPPARMGVASGRVKVGVRPEKIRIEPAGSVPEAGCNCVRGVVRVSTFTGVGNQYLVDGPGGAELTVYAQNLGSGSAPRSGDEVGLSWRPEHTFVVRPDEPPATEMEGEM